MERCLSREDIRSFYDRFGKKQDLQRIYEGPAISELLLNGRFGSANSVFELGCGTGFFAFELLKNHLPASASYMGIDLSPTMVGLARKRLARFGDRAKVSLSDGSLEFGYPESTFDCFVANYVMDLLPPHEINQAVSEAWRILKPGGRLCLISLTYGRTPFSRASTKAWRYIFMKNPAIVGGCRPLQLEEYLEENMWQLNYHSVVSSFGIASEVIVALKRT